MNNVTHSLSQDVRLRLADDVSFQSLGPGEETVLLSLNSGFLYTCNETTAAFLRTLDGKRSLGAVVAELLNQFRVAPEVLGRDMSKLASKLLEEKLLVEEV